MKACIGAVVFIACLSAGVGRSQNSKGYDVISYDARVTLDRDADSLQGEVTMTAFSRSVFSKIVQHAKYLTLDSIFVDGKSATVEWQDTALGIYNVVAPQTLDQGKTFKVHTYYHGPGRPEANSMKWGGVSDYDTMMFAMGVGFSVPYTSCTRHWLPCYDLPDDKADSVDLTFITKPSDIVASNGLLVSDEVLGGTRVMRWHVYHPIASYLLTFATGPYTKATVPNAIGKPFEVYALQRDSAATALQMNARVARALAYYDSLFVPYPFSKVGYVVTPIGSMEHQTMISLVNSALDTSEQSTTAVHELAHQWWGDWVTCQTFDDAWLNEGFATYCESLILERFYGRGVYLARQQTNITGAKKGTQYALFGAPSATNHANNYPYNCLYQKGAAVLGMLREYLGDSVFFAGLRTYGKAHAYNTATSYDLEQAFEEVSGQNLGWFFVPYVLKPGYPKITVRWSKSANGATLEFTQTQDTTKYPLFRLPLTVQATDSLGNKTRVRVWMDSAHVSSTSAALGFTPATIQIDPDGLMLKQVNSITLAVAPSPVRSPLDLRVFPNPATDELHFAISAPRARLAGELSLYDLTGKLIRTESIDTMSGNWSASLSTSGIAAGAYALTFESRGGERVTTNVTIER